MFLTKCDKSIKAPRKTEFCWSTVLLHPHSPGSERFLSAHSCSHYKDRCDGNASVINSQGNEVTVDSQFSRRKLAFITHRILWSKQASRERLSRRMTTSFAETVILMWMKRRKKIQQIINGEKITQGGTDQSKKSQWIHLLLISDDAAKQILSLKEAVPWHVNNGWDVALFSALWGFSPPDIWGVTAITFTGSTLIWFPISHH